MAELRRTAGLGQLHALFTVGTLGGLTDQELLDRFVSRRDQDAFAALVQRHAPMVLRVCGGVLRDLHDAEDASQATFLILARKAASIRRQGSLGSWLLGVARRVSGRARADLRRQRELEQRGAEMAVRHVEESGVSFESWAAVCDELERLPERYRVPIVLCDLDSLTHEQAAAQLRQSPRTIRRRLAAGREMLRARLARHGMTHSASSLSLVLAPPATRTTVPTVWAETTVRAAVRIISGQAMAFATSARVACWAEGVITTMFLTKVRVALALILALGIISAGAGVYARNLWDASDDKVPTAKLPAIQTKPIAAVTDPKSAVGRIADHITENYARLRTVRTNLQTTHRDRSVTKREEVTNELPNGGRVQLVREPSSVRRERLLLSGKDVYRESLDEDGEIWSFQDGVYTQYVPKAKTAWLRLPEGMPGIFPLDPRNIASMEQRSVFAERLRGDRALEAGLTQTLDGQARMVALMEHTFDQGQKQRYRCEFDIARNDLPTRIIFLRDEDKIGCVLDITYQEVIPGKAWFLQKATRKSFGRDPARSADSEGWRQVMIVETTGKLIFNEPIAAAEFVVKLPEDVRISDAVHDSVYKYGENARQD